MKSEISFSRVRERINSKMKDAMNVEVKERAEEKREEEKEDPRNKGPQRLKEIARVRNQIKIGAKEREHSSQTQRCHL